MTWTLTSSPLRALMAWAPASVAALTAATSPTTHAVTRALPTWVTGPTSSTFAALSMASVPSTRATSPRVSMSPIACGIVCSLVDGYLIFLRIQKSFGFASDNEFFVGGDHENLHFGIRRADDGFHGAGGVVFVVIDPDAEVAEVRADGGARPGVVFARAGGKDDRVCAVQFQKVSAEPVAGAGDKNIQGEFGIGITFIGGGFDVAHVIGNATQPEQARTRGQLLLRFLDADAQSFCGV